MARRDGLHMRRFSDAHNDNLILRFFIPLPRLPRLESCSLTAPISCFMDLAGSDELAAVPNDAGEGTVQ